MYFCQLVFEFSIVQIENHDNDDGKSLLTHASHNNLIIDLLNTCVESLPPRVMSIHLSLLKPTAKGIRDKIKSPKYKPYKLQIKS